MNEWFSCDDTDVMVFDDGEHEILSFDEWVAYWSECFEL